MVGLSLRTTGATCQHTPLSIRLSATDGERWLVGRSGVAILSSEETLTRGVYWLVIINSLLQCYLLCAILRWFQQFKCILATESRLCRLLWTCAASRRSLCSSSRRSDSTASLQRYLIRPLVSGQVNQPR